MRKTDTINELASALSVAQGEIKHASMNATNPFFKSKYADLGSVIDASKEALKKNGLALSQLSFTEVDEHGMRVGVESVLMHSSGQWISERISLPVEKDNRLSLAQAMGAIISYLRRYSYASMLGIYSDLDTDGSETPQENKAPLHNEPLKKLAEVAKDMPQKMSLEMAKSFTSGDGKPYWDMEVADLVLHFNGLEKQIKAGKDSKGVAYTPQQIEEKQMKRDAITVILKAKQGK